MGWNIQQVMLFKADKNKSIDYLGKTSEATNEVVGIDIALQHGKCFDNHCSRLQLSDYTNKECVNPNIWCGHSRHDYFKKFNLSTTLLLWGIYDIPLPLSEDGKMILLAIDGSYQGFYNSDGKFSYINRNYLRILGLEGLIECAERHKKSDFEDIKKKYRMVTEKRDTKIKVKKGYLETDLDLDAINVAVGWESNIWCELPQEKFHLAAQYWDRQIKLDSTRRYSEQLNSYSENPYSVALTGRDFLCCSELLKEVGK